MEKIKFTILGFLGINALFFYCYILFLSDGYEKARDMCPDKKIYRIEYAALPFTYATCWLTERIEE
jgi:hypothetical protein